MLSTDQLATIRRWCGSKVGGDGDVIDGTDLEERIGRCGSAEAAALEVLGQFRADIVTGNPTSWTITGDQSENWTENLKALDAQIAQLERICNAGSVSVSTISRARPSR